MLVISRQRHESMVLHAEHAGALVTLLSIRGASATLLICNTVDSASSRLETRHVTLSRDEIVPIGKLADLIIVDIGGDKVRLGFDVHQRCDVHRLEVWEAIQNERRSTRGEDEDGTAGQLAPRPSGPKPPMLDVRLPPPSDEAT